MNISKNDKMIKENISDKMNSNNSKNNNNENGKNNIHIRIDDVNLIFDDDIP